MKNIPHDITSMFILFAMCLLLISCVTMKNGDTRPTEGICAMTYDSAKVGEQEILAGKILLPTGVLLTTSGALGIAFSTIPAAYKNLDPIPLRIMSGLLTGLGGASLIAGIVTLIDGHRRVDKWNEYCVGATAAERYCLFDDTAELNER